MKPATKKQNILLTATLVLPVLLVGLFYLLRGQKSLMDAWVGGVVAPVEQFLSRVWSIFPFSVMEVLIAAFLVFNLVWLVHAVVLVVRGKEWKGLLRRVLALAAAWLWLWVGLCWMWNVCYYAATFTEKSGLSSQGHSPQELFIATVWFAQNAAQLAGEMERDAEGHFAEDQAAYFQRAVSVYDNFTQEFPFLNVPAVRAKPLVCSRLQSILGFTGMYFPFTGEANVNVDAPACLRPATITHEMSHQRMVASELEANFVGIAAAVTSDDVVFQYSGYLMGLIELSNALYKISPEAWQAVVDVCFTEELSMDWNDNYYYWKALESSVDDAAERTYDSYLRGNGQSLGIASYGACVDLLIEYFG